MVRHSHAGQPHHVFQASSTWKFATRFIIRPCCDNPQKKLQSIIGTAYFYHTMRDSLTVHRTTFNSMTRLRFLGIFLFLTGLQSCGAVRRIRFASPLQSLTIPDPEIQAEEDLNTPRKRFLPKFLAGLSAEALARKELALSRSRTAQQVSADTVSGADWADKTAGSELARRRQEESIIDAAFDQAVAGVESVEKALDKASKFLNPSRNKYQFVGVINRKARADPQQKPIVWYARKKPQTAKWSVRLVHVNQDAIIKDLFNRGEIDIFAKYKNTGKFDEETKMPIVQSKYEVRERSWK